MKNLIFTALLILSAGYALYRGQRYERLVAIICVAATIVSVALHSPLHERYAGIETVDLVVDCALLAAFVLIALRSDRFWPLWVAGLQLTMSISHLLKAIEPDLLPFAYAAAQRSWSYPILIILAVGTWRGRKRQRAEGFAAA